DGARCGEFRAVVASRRPPADLRVQRQGSEAAELRHLPDQPGWHGARAGDVQRHLRRLPDVLARRPSPGVRVEPEREGRRGDERVYRGLGELGSGLAVDTPTSRPPSFQLGSWRLGVLASWTESVVVVHLELPVGERLRARTDAGNVGIDAFGKIRPVGGALALGQAGSLVVALRDARLLALPFVGRRS